MSEKVMNGMDLVWKRWLDNVTYLSQLQDDFTKEAVKRLNSVYKVVESLEELQQRTQEKSEEIAEMMNEQFRKKFETSFSINHKEFDDRSFQDIEKMNKHVQDLFWSANKALVDFLTISQNEAKKLLKTAVDEQRREREKTVDYLTELVEEIKKRSSSEATRN